MAFKVMPTSHTPRSRAENAVNQPRINQYRLVLLITLLLFVAFVVIALVQSS